MNNIFPYQHLWYFDALGENLMESRKLILKIVFDPFDVGQRRKI